MIWGPQNAQAMLSVCCSQVKDVSSLQWLLQYGFRLVLISEQNFLELSLTRKCRYTEKTDSI